MIQSSTTTKMKLKKLEIELEEWGANKGQYKGNVEFIGDSGSISLALPAELSLEFLKFASDALVRVSERANASLSESIKSSVAIAANPEQRAIEV